eukprot:CAMPEP_0170570940 /NCGR_PEP_ID=MMETSP0224-20130122/1391_1 /TAXON_ID=285029 /ORGANISM="Togula jolla, Strain CCCM 725" /LENGTH=596 /DNA_ID=CAMNT_0010893277 /DNA_START=14 /DNA_END=1804 /DNA_ORIENTATION=+
MTLTISDNFREGVSAAGEQILTGLRSDMASMLETHTFGVIITFCTLVSVILLVVETDYNADELDIPMWVTTGSRILLVFYIIELMIRASAYRWKLFRDPASVVDIIVVLVDLISEVVNLVYHKDFAIFRFPRLLRLTRSRKIIKAVPALHLQVRCLLGAVAPLCWGGVLIALMLLFWGLLAVPFIHPVNLEVARMGLYDDCDRCPRAFESVWMSMLTFTQQIISGDSWGQITLPLIELQPELSIFFVGVFVSIAMALMNVMLAGVVDSANQARSEDDRARSIQKEEDRRKAHKRLVQVGRELDTDRDGYISKEELRQGFKVHQAFRQSMEAMDICDRDLSALFSILDRDRSGFVDYTEFTEQLWRMKSEDQHTLMMFLKNDAEDLKTGLEQTLQLLQHVALGLMPQIPRDLLVSGRATSQIQPEKARRSGTCPEERILKVLSESDESHLVLDRAPECSPYSSLETRQTETTERRGMAPDAEGNVQAVRVSEHAGDQGLSSETWASSRGLNSRSSQHRRVQGEEWATPRCLNPRSSHRWRVQSDDEEHFEFVMTSEEGAEGSLPLRPNSGPGDAVTRDMLPPFDGLQPLELDLKQTL